jgi:hypothetical protein
MLVYYTLYVFCLRLTLVRVTLSALFFFTAGTAVTGITGNNIGFPVLSNNALPFIGSQQNTWLLDLHLLKKTSESCFATA